MVLAHFVRFWPNGAEDLSLAGTATSIIFVADKHVFVATKHVFCLDKSMLVATKTLLVAAPANDKNLVPLKQRQAIL